MNTIKLMIVATGLVAVFGARANEESTLTQEELVKYFGGQWLTGRMQKCYNAAQGERQLTHQVFEPCFYSAVHAYTSNPESEESNNDLRFAFNMTHEFLKGAKNFYYNPLLTSDDYAGYLDGIDPFNAGDEALLAKVGFSSDRFLPIYSLFTGKGMLSIKDRPQLNILLARIQRQDSYKKWLAQGKVW